MIALVRPLTVVFFAASQARAERVFSAADFKAESPCCLSFEFEHRVHLLG